MIRQHQLEQPRPKPRTDRSTANQITAQQEPGRLGMITRDIHLLAQCLANDR